MTNRDEINQIKQRILKDKRFDISFGMTIKPPDSNTGCGSNYNLFLTECMKKRLIKYHKNQTIALQELKNEKLRELL